MKRTWRHYLRPIIAGVLEAHKDSDERTIKQALRDAYPLHIRGKHPYRIWLNEIKKQRKKPLQAKPDQTGQLNLF